MIDIRLANIESVLKNMDKRLAALERESTQPQPAPTLVEAVEDLLMYADAGYGKFYKFIETLRLALDRHKRREELVDALVCATRTHAESLGINCSLMTVREHVRNLDAFNRGGE